MNYSSHPHTVWAIPYLDTQPVPQIAAHLAPWLAKDRREAVEGAMQKDSTGKIVHDGSGLEKAERSLRSAQAALKSATDEKEIAFLQYQCGMAQSKVEFYTGKIHLLDKMIAQAS